MDTAAPSQRIARLSDNVARVIRGRPDVVRFALVALLARGHLLLEDVPGVGKTTLARALARSIRGSFRRIQLTSDLLPSDVVGSAVWNAKASDFEFREGPIFANIVLADELNRAMPKTQGALLEAMNEGQVTVDGHTRALPEPFMVLATQNPLDHVGTFPLPESQLDRFLMCVPLGYPPPDAEREIVQARDGSRLVEELGPVMDVSEVRELQKEVDDVHGSEPWVDYLLSILSATRTAPELRLGVSPRGGQVFLRAAKALALLEGRAYAIPEDLQQLAVVVLAHRVVVRESLDAEGSRRRAENVIREILGRVPVPA